MPYIVLVWKELVAAGNCCRGYRKSSFLWLCGFDSHASTGCYSLEENKQM
jgi:hypothetical protein